MWPQTREVIRLVRPRFAFLENVPGLLAQSHGYFGTILSDLAEIGYDARWCVLSAADCGAPHQRKRLWVMAYIARSCNSAESGHDGKAQPVANANSCRFTREEEQADARLSMSALFRGSVADAKRHKDWPKCKTGFTVDATRWQAEPNVGRVAHGVASRLYIP
jgi:DNA (cytosine-5)-methyltransferase 1